MASVTLPASVYSINSGAFNYCSALTSVIYQAAAANATSIAIGTNNSPLTDAVWTCTDGLGSFSAPVSGYLNGSISWRLENGILIISGSGSMPNYSSSAPAPWYTYKNSITDVVLENGIRSVGSYAFYSHSTLSSISFASSVSLINEYAFANDSALSTVILPNGLTSIGSYAFKETGLTSIIVPDTVTYVGNNAFQSCKQLNSAVLAANLSSISSSLFSSCDNLQEIVIPNRVTSIGSYAFSSCSALTSVTLPAGINSVDSGAFNYCSSLTDVYYNGTEDEAFALPVGTNNASLKAATWHYLEVITTNPIDQLANVLRLPAYLEVIEEEAFYGTGAQAVVVPDSVTRIDAYAFGGSSTLQYVQMPSSVISIDKDAFTGSIVRIVCSRNSYALIWARMNQVPCLILP